MNYAKLIDNEIQFAPRKLVMETTFEVDGKSVTDLYAVYNPTAEQYASLGWLPVKETVPPEAEAGYHYEPSYTQGDGEIVQEWTLVEDESSDEISADEALEIIMGGADDA